MSLTAQWKLNKTKCTTQQPVMKLMGRKAWEISLVDKADEDFRLLHFCKPPTGAGTPELHFFDKYVIIYLDSMILKMLSFLPLVEFDKIRYSHKLTANGKEKKYADDEKRFGPCASRTTWEATNEYGFPGFTIRWYVNNGMLKVQHFVNRQDELEVHMTMTDHAGKQASCKKVYDRQPFSEDGRHYTQASEYRTWLR
jgi:hypothetical protein